MSQLMLPEDPQFQVPRVGCAAIIERDGKVLLQKRLSKHGAGTWSLPGGHLEHGESPEDCAARETLEEVGVTLENLAFSGLTNDLFAESGKHYVTIFCAGDAVGEPKIMEPEKCSDIGWFAWDDLPQPLFVAFENYVNKYKK